MKMLDKVRNFAVEAHGDQQRKFTKEPYTEHLERVMNICREYTDDERILSAALLHDVLEDTPVTRGELKEFLESIMTTADAAAILHVVIELTDVFVSSAFPDINRRSRKGKEAVRLGNISAEAQTVKYADIIDNVTDIAKQETDFALVYMRECKSFLQRMLRGNQDLYLRAVADVDNALVGYWKKSNIRAL